MPHETHPDQAQPSPALSESEVSHSDAEIEAELLEAMNRIYQSLQKKGLSGEESRDVVRALIDEALGSTKRP